MSAFSLFTHSLTHSFCKPVVHITVLILTKVAEFAPNWKFNVNSFELYKDETKYLDVDSYELCIRYG